MQLQQSIQQVQSRFIIYFLHEDTKALHALSFKAKKLCKSEMYYARFNEFAAAAASGKRYCSKISNTNFQQSVLCCPSMATFRPFEVPRLHQRPCGLSRSLDILCSI